MTGRQDDKETGRQETGRQQGDGRHHTLNTRFNANTDVHCTTPFTPPGVHTITPPPPLVVFQRQIEVRGRRRRETRDGRQGERETESQDDRETG